MLGVVKGRKALVSWSEITFGPTRGPTFLFVVEVDAFGAVPTSIELL